MPRMLPKRVPPTPVPVSVPQRGAGQSAFSRRRPLQRGAIVRAKDGREYRVMRCRAVRCETCGGTGRREWTVKLKGKWGKFETTWKAMVEGGYEEVEV